MKKHKLLLVAFISALLLFSAVAGALLVSVAVANFMVSLPEIVIESDGSIVPETEFIAKSESIYSLEADLQQKYAITIQCSNIVFDGEGRFLDGSASSYDGYANVGIKIENVTNVIVKNVTVSGFGSTNIAFMECSQCSFSKANAGSIGVYGGMDIEIADNNIGELQLEKTGENTITRNNITDMLMVLNSNDNLIARNNIYRIFYRDNNDGNTFLKNNFWCGKGDPYAQNFFEFVGTTFWDDGSVGNYWRDYNGSDLNFDGIGDTPYLIDENNQDNYPLMAPYDIERNTLVMPQAALFAAVTVAAVVVMVSAGLLFYFKKRKR